jgi:hypothetical protein
MASRDDDARHDPGPGALPLWNESFWWTFYDPEEAIGVVFRIGTLPLQGTANLYLFLTRGPHVVQTVADQTLPLPPLAERTRLALGNGLLVEWEPRERFRLRWVHAGSGFDLEWAGISPTYVYPHPPDATVEQVPRHIEHSGRVEGVVTLGGTAYRVRGFGHRDHSWGGERDWEKLVHWDYLNAELGPDLWVHAVRVKLGVDMDHLHLGCLWDGTELHALDGLTIDARYVDGGTRQAGVTARFADERGRRWELVGEPPQVTGGAQFGRTWVKDGITRYRLGDRAGWGIHELGYVEGAAR